MTENSNSITTDKCLYTFLKGYCILVYYFSIKQKTQLWIFYFLECVYLNKYFLM